MKPSTKNARDGYLLVTPSVLGCSLFYAMPFVLVLRYSMVQGVGASQHFVGMSNYVSVWGSEVFQLAFWNTMRFLLVGLPLILIVSYAIALLLKNQIQKHKLLKSVLLFPYIMPVISVIIMVDLLFSSSGLINEGLSALGLPVKDWLQSSASFGVVILLYLWKNAGYSVILLLSGLVMISDDHYAAAELDGASAIQQFRYITMPQMWYSVFFAAVFSLINAFKCFREVFLIGGTHPHKDIYMLQHFINNCFENLSYPKLAVASVLLLIVVTAVFALLYGWVNRKEGFRA